MSVIRNHNYRIGTDTLPNGTVRAKARGRKTNTRTFPAGTSHEDAAFSLAHRIEGERIHHIQLQSSNGDGSKADWNIFIRIGEENA